jgi:hypothetical protein
LGYNTTESNLLSIPSTVLTIGLLVFVAWLSEVVDSRAGVAVLMDAWAFPLLIVLYTFDKNTSPWAYFAVVTLITSAPYVHPIQVAWASRNSYSVKTRYVVFAFMNILLAKLLYLFRTVSARYVATY